MKTMSYIDIFVCFMALEMVKLCTENNCFQIITKVFNFIRHCKICHKISSVHKQSRMISIDNLLTNNLETETACLEECVDSVDSVDSIDQFSLMIMTI